MYNPALEKLRNQAEQRLHQRRMQQLAQWQEQTSMRSLFDPLLNKKARERIGGDNWFETTAKGYAKLFDSDFIEWSRNPGNALINTLTTIGDTLDYAANLVKAPLLAAVKGEDVGTRLADAYGLGDNGRITQNMSELREVIGAPTSGVLGGTAAGALIGTGIVPGLGTLIGAGAGLVVGLASGIAGRYGIELGNTVTDIALEYVVDPANILGAVGAIGDVKHITKVSGASDDIAKMVSDAGGRIKPLAESINHQSINKVSDFAASTTKNIDAESVIDYGMIKMAQSSAKYTDDVVKQQKIFNRTKTTFFKSAYDNDYDSFVKVMTETGARNVNGFFLDDNHLKVMHAAMVRDANLSRGYRVAKLFERFDSKFAKTLWKGTGPGIVYNAGLKNILRLKTLSANKVLNSINPEAETFEILSDVEYDNIFKELDDLGIKYPKQGETLSKADMEDLYDDMQNSIAKLELDGNERLSNVLKGMASKMEFEVHGRLVSAKSVRSNMNLIIRSFYNHKGNISEVLTDPSVQKAVNGIIDILYIRQGENIFFNAAASLGTNKKLIKLISDNEGMSKIAKLAGDHMDMGGSTVVARVMSEVAMKYLDDDPINQYKNIIKSVADKTLKQKHGVIGAEQLMRDELAKAQEAISRKLDKTSDLDAVEKMKYNKAILDLDRAKVDLVSKDFFLPEDVHLLNSAKEAVRHHKELYAAYDTRLDNFLRVTDITMRAIEEKPTATAATELNIISNMNISKESKFASAARSALAAEKIAQAKAAGDLDALTKAKVENELIESATALAAEYISREAMFTPDMIDFAAGGVFAKTEARIYSIARTMVTESKTGRYLNDLHSSIQKQLKFMQEYKNDYSTIIDRLTGLVSEVKTLDEAIATTYPKNVNEAYQDAFNIIMGNESAGVLKGEPLKMAKAIAGDVGTSRIPNLYFNIQDMLPNLNASGKGAVSSRVNSVIALFRQALDDSMPLHFHTVYHRSSSVLKFETKKITEKELSNLELLFKDLFDDPDIALELSSDFKQMFNIYTRLGKIAMHDTNFIETGVPNKLFLDVKQEFENVVNEFTRNKWNPYLAYFYSKRAFLDTHGDMNISHFKEDSKEFLKALNDINNTVAVDEEGKLIMAKVYQGYTASFKKSIFDIIDKHIKGDIDYKHIRSFVANTSHDRSLLTQYINDMVTAVKYIRVMASIEGAFSSIGKTDMLDNVPGMLRNIEGIIDMFMKDTVNNIVLQSDDNLNKVLKLYTDLVQGLDTWFDEINDKLIEPALTKAYKLGDVDLVDIIDSNDVVYKGSNKSYTELFNHTFTRSDNNYNALMSDIKSGFMQVDQKVCKLVDADGVSDIPDDVLIHADMSKILSADLETMLIKRGVDPTPEDVVQFGLSNKVSKKGTLVYNPKYKRDGNEQLLSEDFINGKRAEGFNPRGYAAFKAGKVNSVSWVDPDDNKTYVLYKDFASAYNDVYTLIKDYIQEINGKKYILTVGQNSTNFDNPVILKALNKYAGANVEGILSIDVMEFTRMLQGMAKAREVYDPSQIGKHTKASLKADYDIAAENVRFVEEQLNDAIKTYDYKINNQRNILPHKLDNANNKLEEISSELATLNVSLAFRQSRIAELKNITGNKSEVEYKLRLRAQRRSEADIAFDAENVIKNSEYLKNIKEQIKKFNVDYSYKNNFVPLEIRNIDNTADLVEYLAYKPYAELLVPLPEFEKEYLKRELREHYWSTNLQASLKFNENKNKHSSGIDIRAEFLEDVFDKRYQELLQTDSEWQNILKAEQELAELNNLLDLEKSLENDFDVYAEEAQRIYNELYEPLEPYINNINDLKLQLGQAINKMSAAEKAYLDYEVPVIDKEFDNLMSAMSEIPDSRLEDVFDSLVKHKLIDDVDGLAHNADVDVVMTEAIFNTYKKVLKAESVSNLKDFKDIVSGYANGVNDSLLIQLQEAFDSVKKIISPEFNLDADYIKLLETHLSFDSDYDRRRFERAIEYFNSDVEDMLSPKELRNLWTFVEDFNNFVPSDNVTELNSLVESVDNLRTVLNKIRLVRSNVMKGMWGDSTVTFQSNKHFNTALMCSNYKTIRNSQDFLDLYTLYKGGEVGHVASGSLVEMILNYRNQLGGAANLSYLTEDMDRIYDYVEVMDEFTSFHDDIWEIFSWSIEGLEKGTVDYDKRAQAFSRILDKMFGTGKSEKLRSINGKFEDILKENPLIDQDELYDLVHEAVDPDQFFKDVIEDFNLVDPEGLMYDRVINYVIYCIGSLNKRDISSRYKNSQSLNLLNPTMDRHFIDTYRRVYNDIIGHFKDAHKAEPDKPLVGELQQELEIINRAEEYLNELVSSMRTPLSQISSLHREYSSYGEIPEGWLNYQLGKNSWEINGSLSNITFKHKNRPEDYYMCKKVENKFQELAGIEFDPREKMDVIPYRNEMSESLKSINALLNDKDGIGINELYDLINEFNFKGMDYKVKKINMYSQMYDEIMEALPENNIYKNFAEVQFNRVWSYMDESKTQDMNLRQLYTNYFKAIAVNAYVAKRDQQSVYDTLKALKKPSEDFIRRPLQEAREQMLGLFKRQDGSIDYDSLFNYINNPNNSLQFVVAFKSNKYQRYNITTNSMDDLAEIQIVNVKNPAQLQRLIENSTGQYNFSILDKHTVLQYRQRIGHQQSNRVYRSSILNKLVEMRKWISSYIMAPLKTMSLYNIGFTITNALEGAYKTAMETTGNRASLVKHYGNAQRIHRNWYELNSKIAVATQGSRYFTSRDQLKLLENENILSGIFANHADEFIAGNYAGILADLEKSNLPKYMIKDTKNMLKTTLDESKVLEYISNQISRYNKTSALINELDNYNLDEFKIMANFINSPAAAAEFQNIKKSAELNLIGDSKEDNIYQKTIKKALYSKWFPDRNPLNEITPYANLSRNSDIELINRFAMYLDLVEKGHFENEALNKVLATHFNYGDKSQLESAAELFFPFISFPIRNYMFWMEAMERHPILLKSFIDMALCNWGDEKDNPYNQTKITKGGLRLWNDVSIESGLSVFDAMAFGGNTLNVLTQRKLNPLVGVAIEGAKQLTVGESNLQYRLGRLPIISHVQAGTNLVDSLIKGQPRLYDIAPSLFNEVYKNNRYYYANQGRYAYKSAYNRLYYASGGRRTGINRTRNMVR